MNIWQQILDERKYQISKWGITADDTHTHADWNLFLTFYLSRAIGNWKNNESHQPDAVVRAGLIKVAAIVIAWIEAIDRRNEQSK